MYDLIIIGTGSMGAAGAYYASRRGLNTLMIDVHHPPHDQGAHHGQTRLYRTLYHNDPYQHLLNRAADLWAALEQDHRTALLQRCGVINIAPDDSADLQAKQRMAHSHNLPHTLLDAAQIRTRWAGIAVPDGYCGLYEADAGYTHCEKAVQLLIHAAEAQGADSAFGQTVTHIDREHGALAVRTRDGDRYRARRIALSAGTWTHAIAGLSYRPPFIPVRKTFAWYKAPEQYHEKQSFPGFTLETPQGMYYGFPDSGAGFKIGRHDRGEAMRHPDDRFPYGHYAHDRADTDMILKEFFPNIGEWSDGKVCSYDRTAGEDFIIGAHPDEAGILLLAGFSGHGFKFAPAVGEWIAAFAAEEEPPAYSTYFAPPPAA